MISHVHRTGGGDESDCGKKAWDCHFIAVNAVTVDKRPVDEGLFSWGMLC